VVIVAVVLYSMRIINLILAVLVGIMSVMFLVGTASLLSSMARANTLKRTYQREVEPGDQPLHEPVWVAAPAV